MLGSVKLELKLKFGWNTIDYQDKHTGKSIAFQGDVLRNKKFLF